MNRQKPSNRKKKPGTEKATPRQIRSDILRLLKNNGEKAFRSKEIARQLGYSDNAVYGLFCEVLAELDEKHVIARLKGSRFTYKPRPTRLEGRLQVNPQGFGFVTVEGHEEDFFVRAHQMGTALDGDRVLIGVGAAAREDRRPEAEVIKVLERHRKRTVGTFRSRGPFGIVEPDDLRLTHDIYVAREDFHGAHDGDKVVVSIDAFKKPHARPEGAILEVLGSADNPATRVLALAMSLDVRARFPEEVLQETEAIPATIPGEAIRGRLDLRKKRVFTIDPEDAKDFDDALHIDILPNGNVEVGVHIADVSHYVRPDTALDREAYARGTSVYLVDRVIPMLPEKLSNEVCSLRPHEDTLTFSCIMEITPGGEVRRYQIRESIIHSKQRFSYEDAQVFIDDASAAHPLAEDVRRAAGLAQTLTDQRMAAGSIDFDIPEIKVILDETGIPVRIVRKERKAAHRLVEEFMLLANRTVAAHIAGRKPAPPFVYRIHDHPDQERIQQLATYVRALGLRLPVKNGKLHPGHLNDLLHAVRGKPEEPVVEQAALRAMAKAKYSTQNIGHYGLSFSTYTHFTSPIRRYPDLIVHRLLKHYARSEEGPDETLLQSQCDHTSERERAAVEAERESVKLKQVEFIRNHLGETFEGVVSGVTKFGIFIELVDSLVEGMVHVRDLDDDFYEYDEQSYRLVGLYSGRAFRLGDIVTVQVAAANLETRQVDFALI